MSSLSNFSKRVSKSERLISDLFDDILPIMQWTSSHGAIAAYQTQGGIFGPWQCFFEGIFREDF
jgi:hypothetical protein